MNHPHVVPGWRFDFGSERFDGSVGVITERGIDGHPDMVRAEAVWPDGSRRLFADGEPCHVGLFAYEPSAAPSAAPDGGDGS